MQGQHLLHKISGHGGKVDATAVHPDDRILVRINDMWFFLSDCEPWTPA